jgi:hypothetical protein
MGLRQRPPWSQLLLARIALRTDRDGSLIMAATTGLAWGVAMAWY